jgi:hypothetical protein
MGSPRAPSIWASLTAAGALSFAGFAAADEIGFGGHVSYALGGAFASDPIGDGLRQNLDASFLVGAFHSQHSSIGMWSSRSGWAAGPMVATGFGAYPTYLGAEGGYGSDSGLVGMAALLGLVGRAHPDAGGGATLRLCGDLFLVEAGVRMVAIFIGDPEFQLTGMIGLGRF